MDTIAEIKSRIGIQDLVDRLGLEMHKGSFLRSFSHEDKNPSMKIYAKYNIFKDYSTGQKGDIIEFYKLYYNIDTSQAVKELAQIAGINTDYTKAERTHSAAQPAAQRMPAHDKTESVLSAMSEDERYIYDERTGLDDSKEATAKALHFVRMMRMNGNSCIYDEMRGFCIRNGADTSAINYLISSRGLAPATLSRFKLFTITDYNELNNHLKKKYDLPALQRSGLYNRKEDGRGNLIFFRHRIIIPYLHNGNMVYLRGRYFDENGSPKTEQNKYLGVINDALGINTPKRFFNSDVLKKMLPGETLYITEGEFDAMVIEQFGFNAIAIPGVGNLPAESQIKKLRAFNCVFCGDSDEAGNSLNQKLTEIFNQMGRDLKTKRLPDGIKDVNDYMVSNA